MPSADPKDLAAHPDRVRRRHFPYRADVCVREIPCGWLVARPSAAPAPYPSSSATNRVHWLVPPRAISRADVDAMTEQARGLGCRRVYIWLAPWGRDAAAVQAFSDAGLQPCTNVRYVVLARPVGEYAPPRACGFPVRRVEPHDVAAVMTSFRNLVACRFVPALEWVVCVWDNPDHPPADARGSSSVRARRRPAIPARPGRRSPAVPAA